MTWLLTSTGREHHLDAQRLAHAQAITLTPHAGAPA